MTNITLHSIISIYTKTTTINSIKESNKDKFHSLEFLPIELIELISSYLSFSDIARWKRVNLSFYNLLSSPHLYSNISLTSINTPPTLLLFLSHILSGTKRLSLRSLTSPLLSYLFQFTSSSLQNLDLSFSAVSDSILNDLYELGGLKGLKVLKLKGCRYVRDGILLAAILPKVERLDLSWSSIESLPSLSTSTSANSSYSSEDSDDSGFFDMSDIESYEAFPSLRHLSLSSCFLAVEHISRFLENLPPTLQSIDLSHLNLTYSDLVVLNQQPLINYSQSNSKLQLHTIDLRGNDTLTRNSIRRLEKLWGATTTTTSTTTSHCTYSSTNGGLKILNEALLESDEEEDVRKFVELVSGVANRGRI